MENLVVASYGLGPTNDSLRRLLGFVKSSSRSVGLLVPATHGEYPLTSVAGMIWSQLPGLSCSRRIHPRCILLTMIFCPVVASGVTTTSKHWDVVLGGAEIHTQINSSLMFTLIVCSKT